MDGCNKCCEIGSVSLTYGSLQVLRRNNDTIIEKRNGSNICCQLTRHSIYTFVKSGGKTIIIKYDISLLQLSLCKNIAHLKNAWMQLLF